MENNTPAIAIFAQTEAQKDYLASLAYMAGYSAVEESAVTSLRVENGFLLIETGREMVRKLALPYRAGAVIDILNLYRTKAGALPAKILMGDCALDTRDNLWLRGDEPPLRLTEKEVAILLLLSKAKGKAVSRQNLLHQVWEYAQGVETHTLETHIYRLRQKIEIDPAMPKILLTQEDGYYIADDLQE